jgi:hypothetical protein
VISLKLDTHFHPFEQLHEQLPSILKGTDVDKLNLHIYGPFMQ